MATGSGEGIYTPLQTGIDITTLGGLRDVVKRTVGRNTDWHKKDDLIDGYINWAQRELARYHDWSFLFDMEEIVISPDNPYLEAETDSVKKIFTIKMRGSNSYNLDCLNFRQVDNQYEDETETGKPEAYYKFGEKIRFVPVPDNEYTIMWRIVKYPDNLYEDNDVTAFGRNGEIVAYLAAMHFAYQLGMIDRYNEIKTLVFNHYPLGSPKKRGLLPQAVRDDRDRAPEEVWKLAETRTTLGPGEGTGHQKGIADPRVGL